MPLITLNSPRGKSLRIPAKPVTDIDSQVLPYLDEAKHIVAREKGIGLAATQMGIPYRWYIDLAEKVYINPEIFEKENEQEIVEGCLSQPGRWFTMTRYEDIAMRFTNIDNEEETLKFHGLSAQIAQHELDHLDGVLVSDNGIRKYAGRWNS